MHSFTWVKGVMRASHRQEEGKKSTKKVLRNFFNEPEEELLRSLQVIFSIEKCNCFERDGIFKIKCRISGWFYY